MSLVKTINRFYINEDCVRRLKDFYFNSDAFVSPKFVNTVLHLLANEKPFIESESDSDSVIIKKPGQSLMN